MNYLERTTRLLFGDDIFISYSRADAASYAALLASELAKRKFSCRFDQWASRPGSGVPPEVLRALKHSTLLVVVSTAGAGVSGPVETEISHFLPTGRNIVPIDLDGTIRVAHWWPLIDGLAVSKAEPFSEVLQRIENTVDFTRRNARLRYLATTALAVFALLAVLNVVAGRKTRDAIGRAATEMKRAEAASQARQQSEAEALRQRTLAAAAARDREEAEQKRNAVIAQLQKTEDMAAQSAAVARARELVSASVLSEDTSPELAVLIAAQAVAATGPWGIVLPEAEQQLDGSILASHLGVKLGANDIVSSVAWSPNGTRLVTANMDKTAKIWDVTTGKELFALFGHRDAISSVVWSPDGMQLATASLDHMTKVWDAGTGKEVLTLAGHPESVNSVAWDRDSKRLATASSDQTARVWDGATGKQLLTLVGHRGVVKSVTWSPNGKRLATGSWDQTAKIWDAATGKELLTLEGHSGPIEGVAWNQDGRRLATASVGGTVKVWDVETGKDSLTLNCHHGSVTSVAWSPNGKRLATTSDDGTAKVWDVTTGKELPILGGSKGLIKAIFTNVAWSPDGKRLATAFVGGVQVHTVDIRDLMELARRCVTVHPPVEGCKKYLHMNRCPPVPSLQVGSAQVLHKPSPPIVKITTHLGSKNRRVLRSSPKVCHSFFLYMYNPEA